MERKKVQRLIGVIVVIALGIVLMPLFFQKNDNQIKTAAAKTEEVQPKTVNELGDPDALSTDNKNMDPINISPKLADAANQKYAMTPISQPASPNNMTPINNSQNESPILQTASASEESSELENQDQNKSQDNPAKPQSTTKENKSMLSGKSNKKEVSKNTTGSNQALHRSAWVVQLGSFKEKNNARRLADKLRTAGFKAFMHSVKSKKGEQTRVYIGPETKFAEANSLSKKIEHQLQLKGIIVSYKPLEL